MGIRSLLQPSIGLWKRKPHDKAMQPEKVIPAIGGGLEPIAPPAVGIPVSILSGLAGEAAEGALLAQPILPIFGKSSPSPKQSAEGQELVAGAKDQGSSAAPAAQDPAVADDIMSLFTEESAEDEDLNRLVSNLKEVEIDSLLQECRGIATKLRSRG